jgi:hypothetical protein
MVVGNFRALCTSHAQEGLTAPGLADEFDGDQFWILVEMPNVSPSMSGAAHLSYVFELGTAGIMRQVIFEDPFCSDSCLVNGA